MTFEDFSGLRTLSAVTVGPYNRTANFAAICYLRRSEAVKIWSFLNRYSRVVA